MRPFGEKKLSAKGNVLPLSDFRLFRDMGSPAFNVKKAERAVREAEKMLTKDIPLLPASLYREYQTVGNRANYETPYFLRRDMAVQLAIAESYEKKGRFTEKLMDAVWAIMEESSWIIPAHLYHNHYGNTSSLPPVYSNRYNHGIDLFAASTGAILTAVYILAKDALDEISPIICEKLKYTVHERLVRPYVESTFSWSGEYKNRTNNWDPWIVSNLLFITANLEEEQFVRERVVDKAMFHIDNFTAWYGDDGGCDEGPAYWGMAGACMLDCLELIEDMSDGRLTVYDSPIVKNIGEYIYKVYIDGMSFVNFADCAPRTNPMPSMLIRYGEKCKSPFLVSFGKKQAAFGEFSLHQSVMYRTLKSMCTPDIEADECPMPTYSTLPNLKVMTAREFPDSGKGLFLAAKGGNNNEMHNHNDVGNFIVYYNGKPVIIDTGVGQYTKKTFSPQRYELWFMQSGYHNLPSFDGIDQKNGARYKSQNEVFCEEEKSLTAELSMAYPEEAGLVSFVRKSSLTGSKVTVTDSYELTEEKTVEMHLMTASAPTMLEGNQIKLPEDRVLTYDERYTAEIEEIDPVGMDTVRLWNSEKLWRIKLTVKTKSGSFTLTVE